MRFEFHPRRWKSMKNPRDNTQAAGRGLNCDSSIALSLQSGKPATLQRVGLFSRQMCDDAWFVFFRSPFSIPSNRTMCLSLL